MDGVMRRVRDGRHLLLFQVTSFLPSFFSFFLWSATFLLIFFTMRLDCRALDFFLIFPITLSLSVGCCWGLEEESVYRRSFESASTLHFRLLHF